MTAAHDAAALNRLAKMILLRRFEEAVFWDYIKPHSPIGGFSHLCTGQEAIAVGAAEVYQRGLDSYAGSFRSHGWSLALDMTPRAAMAELFSRRDGCCRGKGGSMHFFDVASGNMGGWNVAAAQIPLGVGAAFAAAYRGNGAVAFIVFGDGAIEQGVFAESMNLAGLLKLPAIFIVEDNGVAMGTKVERHSAEPDLVKRGEGFGMPCRGLDGNDVEAVIAEVTQAADRARNGGGPTYLVARTFRLRGHSMTDPLKYRTREEHESGKASEPIARYTRLLMTRGVLAPDTLDALNQQADQTVADAIRFAQASPNPPLQERFEHVLAEQYPFQGS